MGHLPRTYEALLHLSDERKVIAAAATASGCDACAYYTPDEKGSFALEEQMDLYPERDTRFLGSIHYDGSDPHQIPVHAGDQLKGVLVLHPSEQIYDQSQPESSKQAKLEMARFIVQQHEDAFGLSGKIRKALGARKRLSGKLAYLQTLAEKMMDTYTPDSDQPDHVTGVTELMKHALSAVNKEQPVLASDQAKLVLLLTLLHDVGKAQIASDFLKPWRTEGEEGERRQRYFMRHNHNHPLFTLVTLLPDAQAAVTSAAHHHGVFRYTKDQLEKGLKGSYDQFSILTEDIAPEQLSSLSRMMRVADVTESITGGGEKTLHFAIGEMAKMATPGKDDVTRIAPDTIDPDYLCFMLANGSFKRYGQERDETLGGPGGWRIRHGGPAKYDEAKLNKISGEVLQQFGWIKQAMGADHQPLLPEQWEWTEKRAQKEKEIREAIANDQLILDNPTELGRSSDRPRFLPQRGGWEARL